MSDKYVVVGDDMTQEIDADCMTWHYRTSPPRHVQFDIEELQNNRQGTPGNQPGLPSAGSGRKGSGRSSAGAQKLAQAHGVASDKSEGGVRDALLGWPGGRRPNSSEYRCANDFMDGTGNEAGYKENMFDIIGHTYLNDTQEEKSDNKTAAKEEKMKKAPKNPRKNAAYIVRNNAISEKYNKVEQPLWKMNKFEKRAQPRISTNLRQKKGGGGGGGMGEGGEWGEEGGGDPCTCYPINAGRADSRELRTPVDEGPIPNNYTEQPFENLKDQTDEQLFDV